MKKVHTSELDERRRGGRPRRRCYDMIYECVRKHGCELYEAGEMVHDRMEWRKCTRLNTCCRHMVLL